MSLSIAIVERSSPTDVQDEAALHAVLRFATDAAVAAGRLNVLLLTAPNGNELTLVVGGTETVLGFTYGHGDPPYFASQGTDSAVEPVLTGYYLLGHHTEFPRYTVVPMALGTLAAGEFLTTAALPSCVQWVEA